MGAHLLYFTNVEAFVQRFDDAVKRAGLTHARDLVKYYKVEEMNGFFPAEAAPFRKRETYEHQREYRFVVHTPPDAAQPFTLDVGDLSDICEIVAADGFNDSLTLEHDDRAKPGPPASGLD